MKYFVAYLACCVVYGLLIPTLRPLIERRQQRACFAKQLEIAAALDAFDDHYGCRIREHLLTDERVEIRLDSHAGASSCGASHEPLAPPVHLRQIRDVCRLLQENGELPDESDRGRRQDSVLDDPGSGPGTCWLYTCVPFDNGVFCEAHGTPYGVWAEHDPDRLLAGMGRPCGTQGARPPILAGPTLAEQVRVPLIVGLGCITFFVPPLFLAYCCFRFVRAVFSNECVAVETRELPDPPRRPARPEVVHLLAPPEPVLSALRTGLRCALCGCADGPPRWLSCPTCETAHHAECWEFQGGCAVYGCGHAHGRCGMRRG